MAALTRIVLETVRVMDTMAVYSPNCIACLLPNARLQDAVRVAERVRKAASLLAVPAADGFVNFTASAGAIELTKRDDMVSLFRRAETALEAGQAHGGNCTYHHDGDRCAPVSGNLELVGYFG